jgi:hypothetical protein
MEKQCITIDVYSKAHTVTKIGVAKLPLNKVIELDTSV